MSSRAALLALFVVLTLAGCGSSSRRPPPVSAQMLYGRQVFASRCTACHSLAGLGPSHPSGGDLVGYQMSTADVLLRARSMPPAPTMSDRELRAVAAYVAHEQASRRRSAPGGG